MSKFHPTKISQSPKQSSDISAQKLLENRTRELIRLWERLLEKESFPQVDKWLSEEFKLNSKYGSKDRKWYSEAIFACVRYASLALFLQKSLNPSKEAREAIAPSVPVPSLQGANNDAIPAINLFLPHLLRTAEREVTNGAVENLSEFYQSLRLLDPAMLVLCSHLRTNSLEIVNYLQVAADKKNNIQALFHSFEEHVQGLQQIGNTRALTHPEWCLLLQYFGVPGWYLTHLMHRAEALSWPFETTVGFLQAQNSRPPLWLRLNYPRNEETYAKVAQELESENFVLQRVDASAVIATGAKGIFATQSYKNGLFEIQDLASQLIGGKVENHPGEFIWDTCAGGGGKTMQIASRSENKGVVYATDVRTYKLEEVKKRARRAGFFNIRCMPWDGTNLPDFPREVFNRKGFDWVLVDAPCSSSGTWRRNPDAKYRTFAENFRNLAALQLNILSHAAKGVRVGGKIVYTTCSWLVDENEDVVRNFLKSNPEFQIVSTTLCGAPALNSDTMFAAVLEKTAES